MKMKNYREVESALKAKGITLTGTEPSSGNRSLLHVERKGVRAKFYCGINHVAGHHLLNLVKSARDSLRARGAVFTEEELRDPPEAAPAPVAVVTPAAAPKAEPPPKKTYTLTKLNLQEKADFYALVRSGQNFNDVCAAYKFSPQAAGVLLHDGEAGKFDALLPPEYRSTAPKEAQPEAAAPMAQHAFTLVETPPAPARINPLDPRLLALAAEVGALQEKLANLRQNAQALGITVVAELKVDWA